MLVLRNVGSAGNIVLVDESTASSAAKRFALETTVNYILRPGTSCTLIYDPTLARWTLASTGKVQWNDATAYVDDYGAKGDGVTDDSAAIQAAINTGRSVLFRPATYIAVGLTMNTHGQRLIGAGSGNSSADILGRTILKAPSGSGHILTVGTTTSGARGVSLEDITFHGNGGAASGVFLQNANGARVSRCKAFDCDVGFRIDNSGNASYNNIGIRFRDSNAENCDTWGFAVLPGVTSGASGDNQELLFDGCSAFQCGTNNVGGGFLNKQGHNVFRRCLAEGCSGYGFQMGESIDRNGSGFGALLDGCWAEANSLGNYRFESAVKCMLFWCVNDENWSRNSSKADPPMVFNHRDNFELKISPGFANDDWLEIANASGRVALRAEGASSDLILEVRGKKTGASVGGVRIEQSGGHVGFYGTNPITKPTVTGSRGGNAALASLLSALANLGLITDSTSA